MARLMPRCLPARKRVYVLFGGLMTLVVALSACTTALPTSESATPCAGSSGGASPGSGAAQRLPGCDADPTSTPRQQATATATAATARPTTTTAADPTATASGGDPAAPMATPTDTAQGGGSSIPYSSLADERILDMLTNIQRNGYNPHTGELYINWRYGTAQTPKQTNLSGSGVPDTTRKDALTDLRYLHNLVHYKKLHPQDTRFDDEITKWTAIVKGEFAGTTNARGWLFDELVSLGTLSGDSWFLDQAKGLAASYARHFNTSAGTLVDTKTSTGYMRVDWGIEQGGALVRAGVLFNMPQWTTIGKDTLAYIRGHAYVPQYHAYIHIITDMLRADGSANPAPTIFRKSGVNGGNIKMGEVAQEIISLLHAADASGDATILGMATDLLDNFSAGVNTLKLWDTQYQGYFAQATFPGPDAQHPGTPTVQSTKKEQGRQIQMLEAYVTANHLLGNKYVDMQQEMEHVVEVQAYDVNAHGIGYECHPDWTLMHLNDGTTEDWVTTEAMGIALEGLLAMEDPN